MQSAKEIWKKADDFLNSLEEPEDKKDNGCCKYPNLKMSMQGLEVCENCGSLTTKQLFCDGLQQGQSVYRRKGYSKFLYFRIFLYRCAGMTGNVVVNQEQFKKLQEVMAKEKPTKISIETLRKSLKENKLSSKFLRYLPEIYYFFNPTEKKNIYFKCRSLQKILDTYKKVLKYEKKNKVKLPSSKNYFLRRFFEQNSEYQPFLKFCSPILQIANREVYKQVEEDLQIEYSL